MLHRRTPPLPPEELVTLLRPSGGWPSTSATLAPLDEDADVRSHPAALGKAALAEQRRILEAPDRTGVLRMLLARPSLQDLATLITMPDTDEVVRLLRAIRDLGV